MDAQAVIAALRDRARKYVSLDTPEDADLGDMAIDIATGFLPVVGTAQAGRDFERARREGDRLGMVLSAAGMVPVVGGVAGAANKARKGEAIAEALRAKYPNVDLSLGGDKTLQLGKIVVPKEQRGQGVGTALMNDLIKQADEAGAMVTLSPAADFGGSVGRLKDFYKRFGFVENKGRNKDFAISDAMYRVAQSASPPPKETVKALRGPRAEALETARQNAVKMLGLPENNTAMDRAKALGFGNDVYHGTTKNFPAFDTSKLGASGVDAAEGVFTANNPKIANEFTWSNGSQDGANVMPLILRTSDPVKASTVLDGTTGSAAARVLQQAKRAGYDRVDFPTNMLGAEGTTQVVFDPSRIRSRFAAFDPARVNENDLLGRADPRLLAAIAAGGLGTAAAVSALRNRNKEEEKAAP